jgi:hypothetical protein
MDTPSEKSVSKEPQPLYFVEIGLKSGNVLKGMFLTFEITKDGFGRVSGMSWSVPKESAFEGTNLERFNLMRLDIDSVEYVLSRDTFYVLVDDEKIVVK